MKQYLKAKRMFICVYKTNYFTNTHLKSYKYVYSTQYLLTSRTINMFTFHHISFSFILVLLVNK